MDAAMMPAFRSVIKAGQSAKQMLDLTKSSHRIFSLLNNCGYNFSEVLAKGKIKGKVGKK